MKNSVDIKYSKISPPKHYMLSTNNMEQRPFSRANMSLGRDLPLELIRP